MTTPVNADLWCLKRIERGRGLEVSAPLFAGPCFLEKYVKIPGAVRLHRGLLQMQGR